MSRGFTGKACGQNSHVIYYRRYYLVKTGKASWLHYYKPLSELDLDKILGV